MAGDMTRMSAVLTMKEDIMVAPGRMGYSLMIRKLRPAGGKGLCGRQPGVQQGSATRW